MKKFIFRKFAGFQACRRKIYYQINSFTGIFDSILSSPMLPCFDLSSPPSHFEEPPPPPMGVGAAQFTPMFTTSAENPELHANIRSWRAKNAPKLPSKYLKDWIWNIKQYLNYILMITNQNILAILRTFLNLPKKLWNSAPSQLPQLLLLKLFAKFLTKKISNEHFNLCEAEISIDTIQMN